jgi:hypothetical protein
MPIDLENSKPDPEKIGLCENCRFLQRQKTNRGSQFIRCVRADEDKNFSRYPALPVRVCLGYEPRDGFGRD